MPNTETIEDFYKKKIGWIPEGVRNDIGHFNIFKIGPCAEGRPVSVPYKRRDFYKVMLIKGENIAFHTDNPFEIKKQALTFSNPHIPYKWERLDKISSGVYCIFNQNFFHQFGNLAQYAVFQADGTHVFELTDEQEQKVQAIYDRMFEEIESEYVYKHDILRSLVLELIHIAIKMQPAATQQKHQLNASERIASLFIELLERQFPIDETNLSISLRSASDYASQLNVHVNHLNRALKEITGKTTSQIIAERILKEAKILLKHSTWSVSEIGYALGFLEVAHFNNFFKKNSSLTPLKFRNV